MLTKKLLSAAALAVVSLTAGAQVVGVAVDPKAVKPSGDPADARAAASPDSAVFYEFSGAHYKKLGQVQVPVSFIGPPSSVVITADKTLALVSSSSRFDPAKPGKYLPDNRISVIDLTAKPIRVVQTVELGDSPTSLALNREGTLALAVLGSSDSVQMLSIRDHHVTVLDKISLATAANTKNGPLSPSGAAFSPDGKSVLISLSNAEKVGLYTVEGEHIKTPAVREMTTGVYPASVAFCGNSGFAVVGNYGRGGGDADTVSLIDVAGAVPRVIDTVSVGPSPEGVACSPDGRYAVASVQNMSSVAKTNPLYSPHSLAVLMKIEDRHIRYVTAAPFGAWAQGIGFLDDSRTIFGQSIMDRTMHLFQIEGNTLKEVGKPIVYDDGAPVAYGVSGQ